MLGGVDGAQRQSGWPRVEMVLVIRLAALVAAGLTVNETGILLLSGGARFLIDFSFRDGVMGLIDQSFRLIREYLVEQVPRSPRSIASMSCLLIFAFALPIVLVKRVPWSVMRRFRA